MYRSPKTCSALICMIALGASPAFAQTWNPVSSDAMNNTAMGTDALANPNLDADGGCHNTASGTDTLTVDTSGSYNTATGFASLNSNLAGNNNTGLGAEALYLNTSGNDNTGSGYQALYHNTAGSGNSAYGFQALYDNGLGNNNAAFGAYALTQNRSGIRNTAVGTGALGADQGSYNTALGYYAGEALITGTDNIDIANLGVAVESQTLRVGTQGTSGVAGSGIVRAYIAGIAGTTVTGSAVYITASGQLGVLASSERYKTNIARLGTASERLAELRPVSFTLKNDPSDTVQYGLVAEEVAQVYPELVTHGADGQINGVRYEELAPMLLNEVQHQHEQLAAQASQLAAEDARLTEVGALKQRLAAQDAELAAQHAQLAELTALVSTLTPKQAGAEQLTMR